MALIQRRNAFLNEWVWLVQMPVLAFFRNEERCIAAPGYPRG
jgi:hypothetical protein